MNQSLSTPSIRGILLDIEGTVSPLAFVHEILFPYARSHVRDFLLEQFGSGDIAADLRALRAEHAVDVEQKLQPPPLSNGLRNAEIDSIAAYVSWLIDRDRKTVGLKSLQGKIWRSGYLDGTLKAQIFADVPQAIEGWRRLGLQISIFSSGSSLAQQLFFAHTVSGDLTEYIDNYFDTTIGSKTAIESYLRIATALFLRPMEALFISDVVAELDAASNAGLQTLLSIRPGNRPLAFPSRHQIIQNFDEISLLVSLS
jgi:enolase-phosphatase E1